MTDTDELTPEGRAAWNERIAESFRQAREQLPGGDADSAPRPEEADRAGGQHTLEWPAFPVRLSSCLGRGRALRLLDWEADDGSARGRLFHQDEYAEWRVVRRDGRPRAVELTTELPEYWETLAGHAPERLLELVGEFALSTVPTEAVFGGIDPFAAATTPAQRTEAFRANMLAAGDGLPAPRSPYNDGRRAVCCMVHRSNNLASLIKLVVSASRPLLVRDEVTGRTRYPSGSEAIRGIGATATDGRNSDPLIVEKMVRFGVEGRVTQVDDAVGVYIHDVQRHELVQPDGRDVPEEWVILSRGAVALSGQVYPRRLKLELPRDVDFDLNDLIVRRTGERLRYGGQLAELVQLAITIRTTAPVDGARIEPVDISPVPTLDCSEEAASWQQFVAKEPDGMALR